jgi:hypothetical protein
MRRAVRDAVAAALGHTPSDEEIEAALAALGAQTAAELKVELRRAEAAFADRGSRGVELADHIDRLRIALAARGTRQPTDRGEEVRPCRVRLRQTISCKPTDDPDDRIGFIILGDTTGIFHRVARTCRETADWDGARLVDRESDVGLGHVEFDTALVWHLPEDLPEPDRDDPHPCNFVVTESDDSGGWNVVNIPLELLEVE